MTVLQSSTLSNTIIIKAVAHCRVNIGPQSPTLTQYWFKASCLLWLLSRCYIHHNYLVHDIVATLNQRQYSTSQQRREASGQVVRNAESFHHSFKLRSSITLVNLVLWKIRISDPDTPPPPPTLRTSLSLTPALIPARVSPISPAGCVRNRNRKRRWKVGERPDCADSTGNFRCPVSSWKKTRLPSRYYDLVGVATLVQANARHWTNVGLMLDRRRRRRANINSTWVDVSCLQTRKAVFAYFSIELLLPVGFAEKSTASWTTVNLRDVLQELAMSN